MKMIQEMWSLFTGRPDFFGGLLLEHLEISLLAIAIAIVVGGFAGIVISEYSRLAKPTLGVVNFLYTIPSISMLGFLIPFSGVGNATAVIALRCTRCFPWCETLTPGYPTLTRPFWRRQRAWEAPGFRCSGKSNCRWQCL